jgi:hypothetical protein
MGKYTHALIGIVLPRCTASSLSMKESTTQPCGVRELSTYHILRQYFDTGLANCSWQIVFWVELEPGKSFINNRTEHETVKYVEAWNMQCTIEHWKLRRIAILLNFLKSAAVKPNERHRISPTWKGEYRESAAMPRSVTELIIKINKTGSLRTIYE